MQSHHCVFIILERLLLVSAHTYLSYSGRAVQDKATIMTESTNGRKRICCTLQYGEPGQLHWSRYYSSKTRSLPYTGTATSLHDDGS